MSISCPLGLGFSLRQPAGLCMGNGLHGVVAKCHDDLYIEKIKDQRVYAAAKGLNS